MSDAGSDIAEHTHGDGPRAYAHTHAWAGQPHSHLLRAVCGRPECAGCATHNIHPEGRRAPVEPTEGEAGVELDVHLSVGLRQLTFQRAALLAANPAGGGHLEGLLNLCDHISDAYEAAGLFPEADRRRWWAEACAHYQLGDPETD